MIFLAREQIPSTSPSRIAQALSWLAGVYFSLIIMSSMLSTLLFFLLPYIPHYFFYKIMGRIFHIEEKEINDAKSMASGWNILSYFCCTFRCV